MERTHGITKRVIADTPVAILDFETTGLTPGVDRVVEVSVVRVAPGSGPQIVFDTLINPVRPMAATEIHGITDNDVAKAPRFLDIAGDLVDALHGSVIAAYNVYFDIRFLEFELRNAGVDYEPPHFCLMYLRPMLGLGSRCTLEEACRHYGIACPAKHVAANDSMASSALLAHYSDAARKQGIRTFADLAKLKNYKFINSFAKDPFPPSSAFHLHSCGRRCSRAVPSHATASSPQRAAISAYWDVLRTMHADLEITDEELACVMTERQRLRLSPQQIRSVHARVFANIISQFTHDQLLDDREMEKLRRLHHCLAKLGWAPGQ